MQTETLSQRLDEAKALFEKALNKAKEETRIAEEELKQLKEQNAH